MEVGIEYLQRTNTIEGKIIMPYMISKYLMDHEMMKPLVIDSFKRTPTYSLSVMKRVRIRIFSVFFVIHFASARFFSLYIPSAISCLPYSLALANSLIGCTYQFLFVFPSFH